MPAAVLFDLGRGGSFRCRPDAAFGRSAAIAAMARRRPSPVVEGTVGAGTGAVAGGIAGGIGTASQVLPDGSTVAALVAVNAAGSVFDRATGMLFGAPMLVAADPRVRRPSRAEVSAAPSRLPPPAPMLNTTIGVVATDADLTKGQVQRLAGSAHDGLARAVRPAHLLTDGDTFFALATGTFTRSEDTTAAGGVRLVNALLAAAADTVTRAIVHSVLAASGHPDRPSYRELLPSSVVASRR